MVSLRRCPFYPFHFFSSLKLNSKIVISSSLSVLLLDRRPLEGFDAKMSFKRYRIIFILIFMRMNGSFADQTTNAQPSGKWFLLFLCFFSRFRETLSGSWQLLGIAVTIQSTIFLCVLLSSVCPATSGIAFVARRWLAIMTLLLIPLSISSSHDIHAEVRKAAKALLSRSRSADVINRLFFMAHTRRVQKALHFHSWAKLKSSFCSRSRLAHKSISTRVPNGAKWDDKNLLSCAAATSSPNRHHHRRPESTLRWANFGRILWFLIVRVHKTPSIGSMGTDGFGFLVCW